MSYLRDRSQFVMVGQAISSETLLQCGVPQGSVLGPLLFSLYTSQVGSIIEKHGLNRKMFADDTELYGSFKPTVESTLVLVDKVEGCCDELKEWMSANKLKLNDQKTEVLVCGSKRSLEKLDLQSVRIGTAAIAPSASVRNLGLIIDSQLTMSDHVSSVIKTCYFFIRMLGRLRPLLNRETANAVAVSLILSRLDFSNGCLWGMTQTQVQRLQRVQNTAARIVLRKKKFDHATPMLKTLHWLPVESRLDYKVLSLAFECFNQTAPEYLSELVPLHQPQRSLRSASQCRLQLPSVSTGNTNKRTMGFRAFSNAAPRLWNSLPLELKKSPSSQSFRKGLKTCLFRAVDH